MSGSLDSPRLINHCQRLDFSKVQLERALELAGLQPRRYPPALFLTYAKVEKLGPSPAMVVKCFMDTCSPECRAAVVEMYSQLGIKFCRKPERYLARANYLSELFFLLGIERTPRATEALISLVKDKARFRTLPVGLGRRVLGVLKGSPFVESNLWRRIFKRDRGAYALVLLNVLAEIEPHLGLKALDRAPIPDEAAGDTLFAMLSFAEKGVRRPSGWANLVRARLPKYTGDKEAAVRDWLGTLKE